jgi:hypothetical protein
MQSDGAGKLVRPPEYERLEGPVIFLAGPIQGVHTWQQQAIEHIQRTAPDVHIASPRRLMYDEPGFDFDGQVDWETFHLRKAGRHGVILFWLAKETEHRCDRSYAQTTRFELAEWKVRHERDGCKVVVGMEEGFTGGRYILRRLAQDCPGIPVCATLQETCEQAVRLAREQAAPEALVR